MLRPYYHEFAWAYDLLQTDAVGPRVDFIQATLHEHGISGDAKLLDAGCGTGRYAVELAGRGFRVCGMDRSAELIAVARTRPAPEQNEPFWLVGDLLEASFPYVFEAVLCRGVLNDFVDDVARSTMFSRFAAWLRPGGILIFDVREWSKTVERYSKDPVHRKTIELPNGVLRFHSETILDAAAQRLLVHERFVLERDGRTSTTENDFMMRCWTEDEIARHFSAAGLKQMSMHPGYGDDAWSDRLVVVARRS